MNIAIYITGVNQGKISVFLYVINMVTNGDVRLFSFYWHHLNHSKYTSDEVRLFRNIYKVNAKKNTWKLSEIYFTVQ
jgi:hypothetical protein